MDELGIIIILAVAILPAHLLPSHKFLLRETRNGESRPDETLQWRPWATNQPIQCLWPSFQASWKKGTRMFTSCSSVINYPWLPTDETGTGRIPLIPLTAVSESTHVEQSRRAGEEGTNPLANRMARWLGSLSTWEWGRARRLLLILGNSLWLEDRPWKMATNCRVIKKTWWHVNELLFQPDGWDGRMDGSPGKLRRSFLVEVWVHRSWHLSRAGIKWRATRPRFMAILLCLSGKIKSYGQSSNYHFAKSTKIILHNWCRPHPCKWQQKIRVLCNFTLTIE